jgi:hypothetical protein
VQLSNWQTWGLRGEPKKNVLVLKLALQPLGDAPMRNGTPREILSHFRKFLRLLTGSGVGDREEISNDSAMRKGERCMKDTVHHFSAYPFTMSLKQIKEKKDYGRERPQCLAAERRTSGLERPHLLCAQRAQVLRGVAPAHMFASRARFLESEMYCMSQPRVHIRNPETVRV